MIKLVASLTLLLAAPAVLGTEWRLCVDDAESLLGPPVRGAMHREFQALLGGQVAGVEFASCSGSDRKVRLGVRAEPPAGLGGVLGLAYRDGDRIVPELRVYYGPVVRYLGEPNNANAVGRALARVAAHEAGHFFDQRANHCELGLMRAALPAYELQAKDRWPFRRALQCGNRQMALAGHAHLSTGVEHGDDQRSDQGPAAPDMR